MSEPTGAFDTEREIGRRIHHERLDEQPMSRPLVISIALVAAAVAALMYEENFMDQGVEQVPVEQTNE